MLSMGVPEITRRYEKDEKCACNLQQYFANSYLCGDEGIKNRCHVILDYLYSIYDEKTYHNENLQNSENGFSRCCYDGNRRKDNNDRTADQGGSSKDCKKQ